MRAQLQTYFAAFARGDGAAVCRTVSSHTRGVLADGAPSCAAGAQSRLHEIPPEIRGELVRTQVGKVSVDGRDAEAHVRLVSRYATAPVAKTVDLRREQGTWRLDDLPGDDRPEVMTTCVIGGIRAFEAGQEDPFWKTEGRADYVAFLRATCRRAVEEKVFTAHQGALTAAQRGRLRRIYADVLGDMIRSGRVNAPRAG